MKYVCRWLKWSHSVGLVFGYALAPSSLETLESLSLDTMVHRQASLTVRIPMAAEKLLESEDALTQYMLKLTASPLLPGMDWQQRDQLCTALIYLAKSVRNSSSTQVWYESFIEQVIE